jgi:hypothetical protein
LKTGWFLESVISASLIVLVIRQPETFLQKYTVKILVRGYPLRRHCDGDATVHLAGLSFGSRPLTMSLFVLIMWSP